MVAAETSDSWLCEACVWVLLRLLMRSGAISGGVAVEGDARKSSSPAVPRRGRPVVMAAAGRYMRSRPGGDHAAAGPLKAKRRNAGRWQVAGRL